MPISTNNARSDPHALTLGSRVDQLSRLGLATVVGGLVGILLLTIWNHEDRGVGVVAVGTEDGISVLVTSGHRRVLIESGATGEALENGLGAHLPPLHRDLDLVLIHKGSGDGARQPQSRHRWTLDRPPMSGSRRLATSSTVSLPNDVSIDLLLEPGPDSRERGWVAAIGLGSSVVAIAGGESDWVSRTVSARRPGILVMAREGSSIEGTGYAAPLVLMGAGEVGQGAPADIGSAVVPMFPAQTMVFLLHARGVEVPDSLADRFDQRAATPRTSSRRLLCRRSSNSHRILARSSSERRTSRSASPIAFATRTAFR